MMLAAIVAVAGIATAQTEQSDIVSATLQSGDQTTVFYGQNALRSAYEAAADAGDVIRLSAGYFDGLTIQKQVSIYGVGFEGDAEAGLAATRTGAITVSQSGEKTNGCYFEGLRIEGNLEVAGTLTKDITVVKCRITNSLYLTANVENVTARQCVIGEVLSRYSYSSWSGYQPSDGYAKNLQVLNCITGGVNHFVTSENIPSTVYIDHCILTGCNQSYTLTNSVVNGGIAVGSTAKGCVFPGTLDETKYTAEGNFYNRAMSTVFTDGVNNIGYEVDGAPRDLIVADDLIGIDGQPIGVHGGNYKFNKIANVPRILSFDATPSEDGKKVTLNLKADVPNAR